MMRAIRPRNAASDCARIVPKTPPKYSGSSRVLQRDAGDDAEAAPAAAFERPEEIGMRAGVRDPHRAVGGDDFGFEQTGGGQAVALGETAEAAALNQSRDADGRTPAALNVAPALVVTAS